MSRTVMARVIANLDLLEKMEGLLEPFDLATFCDTKCELLYLFQPEKMFLTSGVDGPEALPP